MGAPVSAHMTAEDFTRIWTEWVRRLRLGNWEWDVLLGVELEDAEAQITPHVHYDNARIEVKTGWEHWDKQHLNEVVVHELLHVALRDLDHILHMPCEVGAWKGGQASRLYHDALEHALEGFIQRQAQLFVDAYGVVE